MDLIREYLKKLNIDAINNTKKKWSNKFNYCIKCGRSDLPHRSRGLCTKCYAHDIENRHKDGNRIRKIAAAKLTKEFLIEEYVTKMKSLGEIAKNCNCTRQYVHKRLKYYGIPHRTKKDAREIALRRGKIHVERHDSDHESHQIVYQYTRSNENFFSTWSPQMAWVLGLIYTDGNIKPRSGTDASRKTTSRTARISIAQKEPELLIKVLNLLNSNAKIYHRKERMFDSIKAGELYFIEINSNKMYDDLVQLGLTPNKSTTMDFPVLPRECVRHFIRGCWDGDGSVYIDSRSGTLRVSYISGSKLFIEGMILELKRIGLMPGKIYERSGGSFKNPNYMFRISAYQQLVKFYHFLYDDVPKEECLSRKYEKFRKYIEKNEK